MNLGTENRKKTVAAGALGVGALIAIYFIYSNLFGSDTPAPAHPPVITSAAGPATAGTTTTTTPAGSTRTVTGANATAGLGVAPGVPAARVVATGAAGLDPTLDQVAMLRTESLVYGGTGRNIFSATYTPPVALPKNVPPARVKAPSAPPPPPVPTGPPPPPPPPPINLKFFGTVKHHDGRVQAFFLGGDDVYLANQGDIVARKYKIVSVGPTSARVEDLQNNNTQTLPLQMQ